jgi:cobalt-precorrin 5A hydrolase
VNGTAIVTLSNPGAILATALAGELPACDLFLHRGVSRRFRGERFDAVVDFTRGIFGRYRNLIYIMPAGVVVRAIDGLPRHKTADPAVVVVDAAGRYAISLLSGHEGGANGLALRVANILAAEPVISTTTEALKDLIVGVGCRRNANAGDIVMAIKTVLRQARQMRAPAGKRRYKEKRNGPAGSRRPTGTGTAVHLIRGDSRDNETLQPFTLCQFKS